MTHLLRQEQWPAADRPATLGYFCGSLRIEDPDADPRAVVTANATRFLDDHAGHFWPAAAGPDGFAWDLLVDGQRCAATGPGRLAGQYVRANVEGSQRYVQSLPGSQRHRLRVDESGYEHLVLAGDWTNCGLNAGCIEAATMSGLEAANTILGQPADERDHRQLVRGRPVTVAARRPDADDAAFTEEALRLAGLAYDRVMSGVDPHARRDATGAEAGRCRPLDRRSGDRAGGRLRRAAPGPARRPGSADPPAGAPSRERAGATGRAADDDVPAGWSR